MLERDALFLCRDLNTLKAQLQGVVITAGKFPDLEQNVSTDSIFPTRAVNRNPESYGLAALTGHQGINENDLLNRNPNILVVGNGFGRGSSREHAPWALKQAGVNTLICVNGKVERIFQENCLMLGISIFELPYPPETVDDFFCLLNQDSLEQVYQDRLRPDIARSGGLSSYNHLRKEGRVAPYQILHNEFTTNYPMTVVQKLLSKKMINVRPNRHGKKIVVPGDTGFVPIDYGMSYELHSPLLQAVANSHFQDVTARVPFHMYSDHSALSPDRSRYLALTQHQHQFCKQFGMISVNYPSEIPEGIGHSLIIEGAEIKPGDIVVGTDSHTCTHGVFGALAWGIGGTHAINASMTGEALIAVPESMRINLTDNLNPDVSPKDVMLYILSQPYVINGDTTGCVIEYDGEGLDSWTLDQQVVLTNMAVEARAMTGIITRLTPSLRTYLSVRGHMSEADISSSFITPDQNADYFRDITIPLNTVEPMVALPGDPTNSIPLSQLEKTAITNVYIGSCTGGNLDDIRRASNRVESICRTEGIQHIPPGIKLHIQAATKSVYKEAVKRGYIHILESIGAVITGYGCGACIGLGPGSNTDSDVTVSTTNRNFPGRMGGDGPVYLTSAATAIEAALKGYLGNK